MLFMVADVCLSATAKRGTIISSHRLALVQVAPLDGLLSPSFRWRITRRNPGNQMPFVYLDVSAVTFHALCYVDHRQKEKKLREYALEREREREARNWRMKCFHALTSFSTCSENRTFLIIFRTNRTGEYSFSRWYISAEDNVLFAFISANASLRVCIVVRNQYLHFRSIAGIRYAFLVPSFSCLSVIHNVISAWEADIFRYAIRRKISFN